jgi:hypothetical protein
VRQVGHLQRKSLIVYVIPNTSLQEKSIARHTSERPTCLRISKQNTSDRKEKHFFFYLQQRILKLTHISKIQDFLGPLLDDNAFCWIWRHGNLRSYHGDALHKVSRIQTDLWVQMHITYMLSEMRRTKLLLLFCLSWIQRPLQTPRARRFKAWKLISMFVRTLRGDSYCGALSYELGGVQCWHQHIHNNWHIIYQRHVAARLPQC